MSTNPTSKWLST